MACEICDDGRLEAVRPRIDRCSSCRLYWVQVREPEGGSRERYLRCRCGSFLRYPDDRLVYRRNHPARLRRISAWCVGAGFPRWLRRCITAQGCCHAIVCHRCRYVATWR